MYGSCLHELRLASASSANTTRLLDLIQLAVIAVNRLQTQAQGTLSLSAPKQDDLEGTTNSKGMFFTHLVGRTSSAARSLARRRNRRTPLRPSTRPGRRDAAWCFLRRGRRRYQHHIIEKHSAIRRGRELKGTPDVGGLESVGGGVVVVATLRLRRRRLTAPHHGGAERSQRRLPATETTVNKRFKT